jgi:protein TonB
MVDSDPEALRRERVFRRAGLAASLTLQAGLLLALVVVPLFATPVLPRLMALVQLPPLRPAIPVRTEPEVRQRQAASAIVYVPATSSRALSVSRHEQVADAPGVDFGPGAGSGERFDVLDSAASIGPPRPVEPATVPRSKRPISIGGAVMEAMLVRRVEPAYPRIALLARISGSVVLRAVIAKDGAIDSLRVESGNAILANAALEAVRQWRYRPTLLDGEPVEVETLITVSFVLQ